MALINRETQDKVVTLTFNRPDALNALNREMLEAFGKEIDEIRSQKEISVVVLTGSGEKAFIAGADIKEMQSMNPLEASQFSGLGQKILFELEHMPQITIAAVNGFALGGGCELAMACDLIYAGDSAKFGQPELNLGVTPGFGGTQRLLRLVGPIKARELIYTGRMIGAKEAKEIKLVAEVYSANELLSKVNAVATTIVLKGPESLRRAKLALREGMDLDLKRACGIEQEQFALCFASPEQKEGMAAFLEKRKPSWNT